MWRGVLSSSKLSFSSKLLHRNFCSEIFVSRLSHYTTEEELQKTFSKFGKIKEVRLVRDDKTRRPKGFAFVRFESEADAERAIKGMDKRVLLYLIKIVLIEYLCEILNL
ncbi:Cold-inducible RNA-binding protein [Rhynchospora pubera]|uniref:Cold-inducible RNA-binding protein n=1 Tax=Rhynchospora pubera TaxID=906938 RepID=A0AAV8HG15_9POAL|nr:Cold-inducible RNA-binding protein [Rhynchospora pubera]